MDLRNLFSLWFNAFIHPKETFAKEKKNALPQLSLIYYFVAFFAMTLLMLIRDFLFAPQYFYNKTLASTPMILLGLILATVFAVVMVSIGHGILFLFAKLFKGMDNLLQQYYLTSLFAVPLVLLISLIGLIPVQVIIIPLQLIIGIYGLYLLLRVLSEVYAFTLIKAFATLFLATVITLLFLLMFSS